MHPSQRADENRLFSGRECPGSVGLPPCLPVPGAAPKVGAHLCSPASRLVLVPWHNCSTWSGGVTAAPPAGSQGTAVALFPTTFPEVKPRLSPATQAAPRCLQQVAVSLALLSPRPHGPFLEEPAKGVGLLRPRNRLPFCTFMVSSLSASRGLSRGDERALQLIPGLMAQRHK